jgi:nucleotide-binding universal stress UspA family protein
MCIAIFARLRRPQGMARRNRFAAGAAAGRGGRRKFCGPAQLLRRIPFADRPCGDNWRPDPAIFGRGTRAAIGSSMDTLKTIVCAVDFSKGSERALEHAAVLAKATGARIELLHVYQLPVLALPDGVVTATPEFVARLTNQAQEALDAHRARLEALGVRASTCLREGNAVETIVGRANELGASLLVVGTHGRSGFKRFMLGSTAERVVRLATVPVLSVHLAE